MDKFLSDVECEFSVILTCIIIDDDTLNIIQIYIYAHTGKFVINRKSCNRKFRINEKHTDCTMNALEFNWASKGWHLGAEYELSEVTG